MVNISIFAKPATLARGDKHLLRGSSLIRGVQIASKIGARLNPKADYENDICIHVKPGTQELYSGQIKLTEKAHIDVIDSDNEILFARKNPHIAIIACSQADLGMLSERIRNKIILIPQHHCNFERIKRKREGVKTIGIIGAPGVVARFPAELEEKLTKAGFEILKYSSFRTPEDVVNFYQKIDIQAVWRNWPMKLKNPLKVVNAASFGIPTVAYKEETYLELGGICIQVITHDEFVNKVLELCGSQNLYSDYSERCIDKAEEYHIDRIAEKYLKLGKE